MIRHVMIKLMAYIYACILCLFLCGCSPNSIEDFHHEGQAYSRALIRDLHKAQSREELVQLTPNLKKHFEKLVDLMIRARTFQEEHPEESLSVPFQSEMTLSDELEEELRRIYRIEGGREIVERAQQEALVHLDAFERSCAKKKQIILY